MTKESRVPDSEVPLTPGNDTVRIASGLASCSIHSPFGSEHRKVCSDAERKLLEAVGTLIRARALRLDHVPGDMLLDPAWDMMLEMFRAKLWGRPTTETTLSRAARVSAPSGRRWIDTLVSRDLCQRTGRANGGQAMVELSPAGSEAVRSFLAEVMKRPRP